MGCFLRLLVFVRKQLCPRIHQCLFANPLRNVDKLVVLGYVAPSVKPPNTTIEVNHESQPSTVRGQEGGSCALRSVMEEFLLFKLRFVGDYRNHSKTLTAIYQVDPVNATASANAKEG